MNQKPYSNEIQIKIDDVYACPGHCPGCVLSSIERKTFAPDMEFSLLEKTIQKLIDYVPTLKHLEKLNLTYGIGDHFLMDDEYLEKTYHLGADIIEKTGLKNQYNGVFYTASMIGKFEILSAKIDKLSVISKKRGVPFYIIAVLDPKHLYNKNFSDVYKKNIIYAHEITKKVDLAINLSEEAIDKITPLDLYQFAKMNQFEEVTINWTPTDDNLEYVYFDQKKLTKWLIDFDKLISKNSDMGTSYRPVIKRTIDNLMCKTSDEIDFDINLHESIVENIDELVDKSLQIDNKGNIFPKYEAVGDIAHTPRLNIPAWGNMEENLSIKEIIAKSKNKTKQFIQKQFTNAPCISCEYRSFCASSGFHIYNHVLKNAPQKTQQLIQKNIQENGCPHNAKTLFNHYIKEFYIEN